MAYFLTAKAEEDIVDLLADGIQKFGLTEAASYHQLLEEVFQILSHFPKSSPISPKFNGSIRIHPFKKHVILYTIQASGDVLIVRVRHSREKWLASNID